MASDEKERADPRFETPADSDEKQEQSLTRYATIIGIVTGLFGMLFGVALILLPSATTLEKVLVITACLAVAVAGLTGVGAWRSPRKFGFTMLASGLAIVCLADLSIVAADKGRATSPPAASSTPTPSVVISSTRPSSSPTSSPSPAPVFLSSLTANPDVVGDAPVHGHWFINGKTFSRSLAYANACTSQDIITYDLDRNSYKNFIAEVGVADGWDSSHRTAEVHFTVYGKIGTGNFYLISFVSAIPGDPTALNGQIRPGTQELQLKTTLANGCVDSAVVWGNARLTG